MMTTTALSIAAALLFTMSVATAEPRVSEPAPDAPAPTAVTSPMVSTPAPAPAPAPVLTIAPAPTPQVGWAATRLLLACGTVGVLLIGGLKLYRRALQPGSRAARRRGSSSWLARWVPASATDADKITLLARSYLGSRESVCVLRVGTERFLVGVTSAQISMLGRLDGETATDVEPRSADGRHRAATPRVDAAGVSGHAPATPDFSAALSAAASARDGGGDADLRASLARSRDRLARLVAGRTQDA